MARYLTRAEGTPIINKLKDYFYENPELIAGLTPEQAERRLAEVNLPLYNEYKRDASGNFFRSKKGNPPGFSFTEDNPAWEDLWTEIVNDKAARDAEKAAVEKKKQEDADRQVSDKENLRQEVENEYLHGELSKALSEIYGQIEEEGLSEIDDQFIPQRQRVLAEEAALGRRRSPISLLATSKLDEQKGKTIGKFLAGVGQQKAINQTDLAKTLSTNSLTNALSDRDYLLDRLNLSEQSRQFNENLGLEQRKISLGLTQNQDSNLNKELDRRLSRDLKKTSNIQDFKDFTEGFSNLYRFGGK